MILFSTQSIVLKQEQPKVSEFQAKVNKDDGKPLEDKQKKAVLKHLGASEIKDTQKPQKTCTETEKESQKLFSNANEEYVLISGPIYIPKSVLQYSSNLEKSDTYSSDLDKPATFRNPPPWTYSTLHNQADCIKHEVSYASNYPYGGLGRIIQGQQGLVIDSQNFQTPAKILQLRNVKDGDAVSFQTESFLLNR